MMMSSALTHQYHPFVPDSMAVIEAIQIRHAVYNIVLF